MKKEPWESLEWGRRCPDVIKFYENQGNRETAEQFKEMARAHKRWLKSDEGRKELGREQMYERPAMADLGARHLEWRMEDLRAKCESMKVASKNPLPNTNVL